MTTPETDSVLLVASRDWTWDDAETAKRQPGGLVTYARDAESGLLHDIARWIERLAPYGEGYDHHATGEDNGDAHLKSILVHHEVIVPVTAGRLDLGPWQRVFYAEFDGQRDKRLIVKVMGE